VPVAGFDAVLAVVIDSVVVGVLVDMFVVAIEVDAVGFVVAIVVDG
jgi:hypothetical protein